MIDDLRERVHRVPFVPFIIRSTDGGDYSVPTTDHIWFPPGQNRVVVANDEGVTSLLWTIHISAVVALDQPAVNQPST